MSDDHEPAETPLSTVLLVTGAASGMGSAAARLFASRAWRVVGLDVDAETLQGLAAGGVLEPVVADVRDRTYLGPRAQPGSAGALRCARW
jgi:NADP-dependent 3-hydroxy acid dehydrogenase YdfG